MYTENYLNVNILIVSFLNRSNFTRPTYKLILKRTNKASLKKKTLKTNLHSI